MPLTQVGFGLNASLVSGTAVTSTSGTSINFTGIPAGVRRITVMLNNVSFSGGASLRFQIGTSSGVETTGYNSAGGWVGASSTSTTSSNGFDGSGDGSAALSRFGAFTFTLLGSNIWALTGSFNTATPYVFVIAGTKTLSGTLDRVRVTTTNGTDTFDAGSINILYE